MRGNGALRMSSNSRNSIMKSFPEVEIIKVKNTSRGLIEFNPCATSTPSTKRNEKENLIFTRSPIQFACVSRENNKIQNTFKKRLPPGTTLRKVLKRAENDPKPSLNNLGHLAQVPVISEPIESSDEDDNRVIKRRKKKMENPPKARPSTSKAKPPTKAPLEKKKANPSNRSAEGRQKLRTRRAVAKTSKPTMCSLNSLEVTIKEGKKALPFPEKTATAQRNKESEKGKGNPQAAQSEQLAEPLERNMFEMSGDEKVLSWLKEVPDRNRLFTTLEDDQVFKSPPKKTPAARGTKRKLKGVKEKAKKMEVQKSVKSIVDSILKEEEELQEKENKPGDERDLLRETIDLVARGLSGRLPNDDSACQTSEKGANSNVSPPQLETKLKGNSGTLPKESVSPSLFETKFKENSGTLPKESVLFDPEKMTTWKALKSQTGVFYSRMIKVSTTLSSGYLKILPSTTMSKTSTCHQNYSLIKGLLSWTQNDHEETIQPGTSMFLHAGEPYVLKNKGDEEALISYFKVPLILQNSQ